jgi:hypothetical protein
MINLKHLLKVSVVWTIIVYVICYAGVALLPSLRAGFMKYALHTDAVLGQNYLTVGSFIAGLIIWNVIAAIGVWLFAYLFNKIKQ